MRRNQKYKLKKLKNIDRLKRKQINIEDKSLIETDVKSIVDILYWFLSIRLDYDLDLNLNLTYFIILFG